MDTMCKEASRRATELIGAEEQPALPTAGREHRCEIVVTPSRTFEAAMRLHKKYPDKKIGVLNFASAMRPGGGCWRNRITFPENGSTSGLRSMRADGICRSGFCCMSRSRSRKKTGAA